MESHPERTNTFEDPVAKHASTGSKWIGFFLSLVMAAAVGSAVTSIVLHDKFHPLDPSTAESGICEACECPLPTKDHAIPSPTRGTTLEKEQIIFIVDSIKDSVLKAVKEEVGAVYTAKNELFERSVTGKVTESVTASVTESVTASIVESTREEHRHLEAAIDTKLSEALQDIHTHVHTHEHTHEQVHEQERGLEELNKESHAENDKFAKTEAWFETLLSSVSSIQADFAKFDERLLDLQFPTEQFHGLLSDIGRLFHEQNLVIQSLSGTAEPARDLRVDETLGAYWDEMIELKTRKSKEDIAHLQQMLEEMEERFSTHLEGTGSKLESMLEELWKKKQDSSDKKVVYIDTDLQPETELVTPTHDKIEEENVPGVNVEVEGAAAERSEVTDDVPPVLPGTLSTDETGVVSAAIHAITKDVLEMDVSSAGEHSSTAGESSSNVLESSNAGESSLSGGESSLSGAESSLNGGESSANGGESSSNGGEPSSSVLEFSSEVKELSSSGKESSSDSEDRSLKNGEELSLDVEALAVNAQKLVDSIPPVQTDVIDQEISDIMKAQDTQTDNTSESIPDGGDIPSSTDAKGTGAQGEVTSETSIGEKKEVAAVEEIPIPAEAASETDKTAALSYVKMGEGALANKKSPDVAIREFNKAIKRNPRCLPAYCGHSRAYRAKGDWSKAITAISTALRVPMSESPIEENLLFEETLALAQDLLYQDKEVDAISLMRTVVARVPPDTTRMVRLAEILAIAGQPEHMKEANNVLQSVISAEPENAEALELISTLEAKAKAKAEHEQKKEQHVQEQVDQQGQDEPIPTTPSTSVNRPTEDQPIKLTDSRKDAPLANEIDSSKLDQPITLTDFPKDTLSANEIDPSSVPQIPTGIRPGGGIFGRRPGGANLAGDKRRFVSSVPESLPELELESKFDDDINEIMSKINRDVEEQEGGQGIVGSLLRKIPGFGNTEPKQSNTPPKKSETAKQTPPPPPPRGDGVVKGLAGKLWNKIKQGKTNPADWRTRVDQGP